MMSKEGSNMDYSASSSIDDGWETVTRKPQRQTRENIEFSETRIASVSFIHPTPESANFQPFMVILTGLPGSGKSTFAKSLEKAMPWKFVRVNQDQLGSRGVCQERATQILQEGLCPVIDRCNFNPAQRKYFLEIARENAVPVECVSFVVPAEECVHRCRSRRNHETVEPHEAEKIVGCMAESFIPPRFSEGFRGMRSIRDEDMFNDLLLDIINMQR